jgi:hypothetical protein
VERVIFGCTRGRLKVAAALVVFIMVLALPAMAFAAGNWSNLFPTGTIAKSPNMVGGLWHGTGVRPTTASVLVDGVSYRPVVSTTVIPGWHQAFTLNNGVYAVTWAAGDPTGVPVATVYTAFPTGTVFANGSHNATVSIQDTATPPVAHPAVFSFTIGAAPVFGTPTPLNGQVIGTLTPVISIPVSSSSAITSVEATVNGAHATATLTAGNLVVTGFTLTEGSNTVAVKASSGSFSASKSWGFTVSLYTDAACSNTVCHTTVCGAGSACGDGIGPRSHKSRRGP